MEKRRGGTKRKIKRNSKATDAMGLYKPRKVLKRA